MITCWDAAQMVLEEATEQFGRMWKEDEEKKDILREYCVAIGYIAERAGSTFFHVTVDPITMRIMISLDVEDLVIRSAEGTTKKDRYGYNLRDLPLSALIDRAVLFRICTDEESGHPMMRFTFPGIWERGCR